MRASVVIAAHNEGEHLLQTVESCIDSSANLDCEIIIVDDASTDGSVGQVAGRFPLVHVYRHETREGASRTKADGAQHAQGDVLVFLDGHTKPEGDAILRLAQDVGGLNGAAVVTPAIAALDVDRWRNRLDQVGHGYTLDLLTLESHWTGLEELRRAEQPLPTALYESPALIGCAFAIGRGLYERLWGFDPHMRSWGVEDLDFGLKCWLMGHQILHDPAAVVGHRFRSSFDNYAVLITDVLHNQLRFARKNFTHAVWSHWVEACRLRNPGGAPGQPEGFWAHAWDIFGHQRASAEQERTYLQSRRTRDEFWYAERFGLDWPRLASGVHPVGALEELVPLSSVAPSPSPSPPPQCRVTSVVPASVTVLVGIPQQFTAQGVALGGVQWTTNPGGSPATGTGVTFRTQWTTSGTKQVTAACRGTSSTATATAVAVTGVLTPRDNFAGRSRVRFGVGEVIDLSFQATPPRTAAQLGGLRWFIDSGGGALTGTAGNAGTGVYTAPANASAVRLVLKVASGPNTGTIVATRNITIVPPNDALMVQQPGTGIKHTTGTWSVGFQGNIFLRPKDISFMFMMWGEGTVPAVATGYCAPLAAVHPVGPLLTVAGGNAANGCQVNAIDTVFSGQLGPPFGVGDFLWAIPWEFSVSGSPRTAFTTANHHATADATGTATITKKGAGPFSRVPADPTSNF